MKAMASLKQRAGLLKAETYSLYLACRDPRVPWYAKVFLLVIVGYALSPIDLIPDFIPFLGYVDDLIIIPAGVFLALKMVPQEVLEECRQKARSVPITPKAKWLGMLIVISVWLMVIYLLFLLVWEIAF
ncbi:MAG: YkvA family protein [Dehalococcoidales bacterium]|nr:YkvA family protein [Dehalococcoidales bacterium]